MPQCLVLSSSIDDHLGVFQRDRLTIVVTNNSASLSECIFVTTFLARNVLKTTSHLTSVWCLSRRPKVIEFKLTDYREVALRWTTLMSVHWNQLCGNVPFPRRDFLERKDLSNFLEWHPYPVHRMAFEDWPSVSTYSMFTFITYKNHSSLYLNSNFQNWLKTR